MSAEIEFDQFLAVDMRVGRVTAVDEFPEARKPAWKLTIDFGPEIGVKRSSAQITNYAREELEGRLVVAVVNFPPRQIGPFMSEVLCLGASDEAGHIILLAPAPRCRSARGSTERAGDELRGIEREARRPGATSTQQGRGFRLAGALRRMRRVEGSKRASPAVSAGAAASVPPLTSAGGERYGQASGPASPRAAASGPAWAPAPTSAGPSRRGGAGDGTGVGVVGRRLSGRPPGSAPRRRRGRRAA